MATKKATEDVRSFTLAIPNSVHQKLKVLTALQGRSSMTKQMITLIEQEYEKAKQEGLPDL